MLRDTFLLDENRFIGHTIQNQYYLIFVKDITPDSITIYKQTISDIQTGMNITIPSPTTNQNYGWNKFGK
jgi:hypothetical protein